MNAAYRDLVAARVRSAIDTANAVAGVSHAGVKGQLREILVRELFRPLFPADVGLGTGQIVAAENRISSQQDVIIYDRRILPAVLYEGTTGLFPVEAVLATIEVKTTLTAAELKNATVAARDVAKLMYLSGLIDPHTGLTTQHPVTRLVPAVFALNSDLSEAGKSEFERLIEIGGTDPEGIRALCIVGRGYWFSIGDKWYKAPQTHQYSEVLAFLASISDGIPAIAGTRHRPPLAHYLFEPGQLPVPGRDAIDLGDKS